VRLAEELGDLRRAGRACVLVLQALTRFGAVTQALTPEYLAWVERLDRLAQPGTVERVWADAQRGWVLRLSGQHAESWELGNRAMALARTLGDIAALSFAAAALIWQEGRPSDRQQRLLAAGEFAHLTENPADEGSLLLINPLFTLFLTAGRRDDAEEQVRRVERYVERSDDAQRGLWAMHYRARLATLDGRFEEALALGDALLQRGEELGAPVTGRLLATQVRMMPLVYLGRAEEALRKLPLAQQLAGAELLPLGSAFRMVLLAHAGRGEEARARLQAFSAVLQERQCSEAELLLTLITAVTLGEAGVGNLAAAALAGGVDYGETIDFFTMTCTARHLGALAALQGDRAGAEARYAQALAVAARNRMRPEMALTHLALAELLLDGDGAEQREAQEHLALAIPEFEAMQMQPALERAQALAYRSPS
jgi:tetratricopeptide (TPR) repeat protein